MSFAPCEIYIACYHIFTRSFAPYTILIPKKLTGVPLYKAFSLFLEGKPPAKKTFTLPSFHPPSLKLQGTNHANDIFYIYKLKTQ